MNESRGQVSIVRVWGFRELGNIAFPATVKERFFVVLAIPVLPSYLDESSDERQEYVTCVAGCCATDKNWDGITGRWKARLDKDDVDYFRATSCKAVSGPFFHHRKKHGSLAAARVVANQIRSDLEGILLTSAFATFMIGLIPSDYEEIITRVPEARWFYSDDPLEHAYAQVMFEITRTIRRKARNHDAAFVIDESLYSPKIIAAYDAMRQNHPSIGKSAKTIMPLDDKLTPPLQVADLMASIAKDVFLDWRLRPAERYAPVPEKWMNHIERIGRWNKAFFVRSILTTLNSPRFAKNALVRREHPERKLSKSERKRLRKELIAQLGKTKNDKSE